MSPGLQKGRGEFLRGAVSTLASLLFHLVVFLLLARTALWVVEARRAEREVPVHFLPRPLRNLQPERPGPPAPQPKAPQQPPESPPSRPPGKPPPAEQSLGVGNLAKLFSLRRGVGHQLGLREGGGTAGSENAVRAALRWLAAHQDRDGRWDPQGFTKHCPPDDPCGGTAPGRIFKWPFDLGVTGLATLAFLGAGNTPEEGDFRDTVARAVGYLLRAQQPSGAFSTEPPVLTKLADGKVVRARRISIYSQAICTLALAECLAMTGREDLRRPVERAVEFLVRSQQDLGGWDYFQFKTGRNDSSVTGWVVMALKSASAAGVRVPPETWYRLFGFVESMSRPDGYFRYANTQRRFGVALAAVGLLCREYLGWPRDSEDLAVTAELLLADPPDWGKLPDYPDLHSMYYWYYGTLALHHLGGTYWERWNRAMRDMLIAHQETRGHRAGSWPPAGLWARQHAGRIYSTALCALNLEIYYRYLPLYRLGPDPGLLEALRYGFSRESVPERRRQLLANLGEYFTPEVGRLLHRALSDEAEEVRFEAARQLVRRGDPAGVGVLREALRSPDSFRRAQAVELLGRVRSREAVGALIEALTDEQEFIVAAAVRNLQALTGERIGVAPAAPAAERERVAEALRRRWKAGGLGVQSLLLEPLATVVAVRRGGPGGDEVIARLSPEGGAAGGGLISGSQFPILRDGVEIARLEVERAFADGSAFVGRVLEGQPVREGDRVFRPVAGATEEATSRPHRSKAPESNLGSGSADGQSSGEHRRRGGTHPPTPPTPPHQPPPPGL